MEKVLDNKKVVIFIVFVLVVVVLFQTLRIVKLESDLRSTLAENEFYPGRTYGDYDDTVFDFDKYFEHIGAKNVNYYMYRIPEGIKQELRFTFDGFDYKVESTICRNVSCLYMIYSEVSAKKKDVTYSTSMLRNGAFIMDMNSPFLMDWLAFDLMHIATDYDSEFRHELQSGTEEEGCPFRAFGVPHYEIWKDGRVIWHDDLGDFTIEDGLDLHY